MSLADPLTRDRACHGEMLHTYVLEWVNDSILKWRGRITFGWGSRSFLEVGALGRALRELARHGEGGWKSRREEKGDDELTERLPCARSRPSHSLCLALSSPVASEGFAQG